MNLQGSGFQGISKVYGKEGEERSHQQTLEGIDLIERDDQETGKGLDVPDEEEAEVEERSLKEAIERQGLVIGLPKVGEAEGLPK
ncbi:uncharacterized protein A4U43_C05F11640 [Asparagus officinalis]|uniref:Uncharacterized protein n=1 Tax=Asparagus officinalis TaxID=4686 RepID=A0A5P1ER15_ASPOF|nr:uncharacterized protein A4U43_C05F11640 [Asparagus officinalis]